MKAVAQYIRTALWSSSDDDGRQFDGRAHDLDPDALKQMTEECIAFLRDNAALIGDMTEDAAHDFWLTRNGHGAGFWDGDWPDGAGEALTAAAKACGPRTLYEGDDGVIYMYNGC